MGSDFDVRPGLNVTEAIRRRRMVRAYTAEPVPPGLVDELVELARRAPSAGNTQPWAFVVLEGDDTATLWDITLPADRREGFSWPGLLEAPVVVVPVVRPGAYTARYQEPDKIQSGLGESEGSWSVPYWWVDGGMAVHALLLAATERGLGALFFGLFDNEQAVLEALEVPDGWRALGAVTLGWPATDRPGRSVARSRPDLSKVLRRHRF